jgi:hypothetical protein
MLMKVAFLCTDLPEKYSNIKFHENSPSGSRVVPCRQWDRRTDRREGGLNIRFSQFENQNFTSFYNVTPLGLLRQPAWRHAPEDWNFHRSCCENLTARPAVLQPP